GVPAARVLARWGGWWGCEATGPTIDVNSRPFANRSACGRRRRQLAPARLRRLLPEELRRALLGLGACQLLFPRRDPPGVPLRVGDGAAAIAPELIRERHPDSGPGTDGAVEQRIGVLGVQPQRGGRSAVA